ncbi:MAG: hypothetical protein JRD89_04345 [Deltaproteobacteria bacterium]|nr:hypothetical protein [Deltaproteobacteria bacterium]
MTNEHQHRRRLVLVVPEFEHPVRAVLDGLDPDSRAAVDEEFEMHIVDRGILRVLDLPAGSVVVRDRDSLEALRGVVEVLGVDPELFPPRPGEVSRQR